MRASIFGRRGDGGAIARRGRAAAGRAAAGLAAAGLAAGCSGLLGIDDVVPGALVSYDETGSGAGSVVVGPGFELRFGGGGFRFPDALVIDGVDVIGRDPAAACAAADEIGLAISPTPRISASSRAVPVASQLSPVLRGPAVVQVQIEWATAFPCNSARTPGGTATYTAFPDGRIVRHDTLVDPVASPISPATCGCDQRGGLFDVSTFWTLAQARYTSLLVPGEGEPKRLPLGESYANKATSCIDGVTHQIAFAWPSFQGTAIRSVGDRLSFGRALAIGEPALADFSYEDSSAIFIGRDGCAEAHARAQAYTERRAIQVNGAGITLPPRDGIYGSDAGEGGTGLPGIPVAAERVTLGGPSDISFAVWLRFPRPVGGLRATRDGATGSWYVPQRVDDRSWIVWFRGPLSSSEQIVIDPR